VRSNGAYAVLIFITTWIFGSHSGFVPNPGLKKCHIIALINTNF